MSQAESKQRVLGEGVHTVELVGVGEVILGTPGIHGWRVEI